MTENTSINKSDNPEWEYLQKHGWFLRNNRFDQTTWQHPLIPRNTLGSSTEEATAWTNAFPELRDYSEESLHG